MIGHPDVEAADRAPDEPRRSWPAACVVAVAGFVVLGLIAGWLWSASVHPPEYVVYREDYTFYSSEVEFSYPFRMDLTFAWIGAAAGVLWGFFLGWRYWPLGWAIVAMTALAACVAAVTAWRFGVELGPPSVEASVDSARAGDTFTGPVELGTRSMMFVWPIATLLGVIVSVWLRAPRDALIAAGHMPNRTEPPG